MEGTGITPVMDMNRGYGDGFGFGGSGLWLFAILALMWGGFGGGYNNGLGYRPATAEDVNNGFNFSELQSENRDILSAISSDTASTISAVERVGGGLTSDIHDLAMNVADTRAHQQECCCNILRAIDATNYNTTAQVQKVLDALAHNKIDALQSTVNSLELAQAVAGVVRYPSSTAYNAGYNPFCNCGGFNGNI